jgi:enoyl-[acyl-carrier protein] reductase I
MAPALRLHSGTAEVYARRMNTGTGLMAGKKGIILGVANDKSIAWGIAQKLHKEGATLAFTYLNEVFEKRVRPLAESLQAELILRCDVSKDAEVEMAFQEVEQKWGSLDFLVHSIAYAGRDELRQPFHQTSREGFRVALDISAYSLIAVTKAALPLMKNGGSVLTMTYLGSLRAMPNYNVMGVAKAALEATVRYLAAELGEKGVRVNAISAGPIRTLAATGISNFSEIFGIMENRSPMHRSVTTAEVGNSALYLLSDLASGVTGEVHFVDTGYNIVGL